VNCDDLVLREITTQNTFIFLFFSQMNSKKKKKIITNSLVCLIVLCSSFSVAPLFLFYSCECRHSDGSHFHLFSLVLLSLRAKQTQKRVSSCVGAPNPFSLFHLGLHTNLRDLGEKENKGVVKARVRVRKRKEGTLFNTHVTDEIVFLNSFFSYFQCFYLYRSCVTAAETVVVICWAMIGVAAQAFFFPYGAPLRR
jgi:hypothetical protein